MSLLRENDRAAIIEQFAALDQPVKIINFTQKFECDSCQETRELIEELAALSGKLSVEIHDFVENKDQVAKYNVDKIPATVLVGDKDYGIRFYGIPSGYEFATLLEDIVMVSKRDSGLAEDSRKKLAALTTPLHLQVFTTPT